MQRFILLFSLLGLLFLTTNCSKNATMSSLEFLETGCSNPWKSKNGKSEAEVKTVVIDFLENDLMIANFKLAITFDENEAQGCYACHCKTGRKIIVEVEKGFVPILEDNGFSLKN